MIARLFITFSFLSIFFSSSFAQDSEPDSLQTNSANEDEQDSDYAVADSEQDSLQRFHARFSADGTASTGNIERVLLQVSTAFDWKPSRFLKLSSSPFYVYGQQNKLLNERELFGDFRATFAHQKRFYGLTFASWERSNLRQITNRWIQAAGVGFKIVQKPKAYLAVTNVLLHESTDFIERGDVDLFRNSTRLSGEFTLDNRFVVASVLYLQPAITQKNNFRWSATLSLSYRLNKAISLRTKFENNYESLVVIGRKNNDFRWTMGLIAEY